MDGRLLWQYASRVTPVASLLFLIVLVLLSLVAEPFGTEWDGRQHGIVTTSQLLFSIYIVMLHVMASLFPIRAFFALGNVMKNMNGTSSLGSNDGYLSSLERSLLHIIIIPTYKEDVETLRSTLSVLAAHPQARWSYHVYLAMEEREKNAAAKATGLITAWSSYFHNMSFTLHPYGLPNEAPGKSSNESWAARQIIKDYHSTKTQNIVVTTMDADTHLSSRYFAQITRHYLASPGTQGITIYTPPIVFDRNLHLAPLPVRTADIMWAAAGISCMCPGSRVVIPTSVYSLPLALIEWVGGWDADYTAIGEDMHMYLKCFFRLSGNLRVQVIYAAASQCNAMSSFTGVRGYVGGIWARYQQAVRHMWGSLDTGFAIRQTIEMLVRRYHAKSEQQGEKHGRGTRMSNSSTTGDLRIRTANVLTVFYRLFEAHFLPLHLVVVLAASSCYTLVFPGFLMPSLLKMALDFCSAYRLFTFGIMLRFFHRYKQYHGLCVGLREEEMRRTGLLEGMIETDAVSPNAFGSGGLFEAALFPIGGFIFGAIPALQAVVSHIFTERLTYTVSLKPKLLYRKQHLKASGKNTVNATIWTISATLESEGPASIIGNV